MSGEVAGWEDLSAFGLDSADERALLAVQNECTFVWLAADGHPVGAVVNFVFRHGSFWVTATDRRPRVAAIRQDPRVCIVVSSRGSGIAQRRALTCRGHARLHHDRPTKEWFFAELAAAVRPGDLVKQGEFARLLDSVGRVVIEVQPTSRSGFDGAKMWASAPQAAPPDLESDGELTG